MRDIDVRLALRRQRLSRFLAEPGTLVVEEMGLCQGDSRIDVAVINGSLHGYEIKSASDTLERLEQQAERYGYVFDRLTLVASKNHLDAATGKLPDWWGIAVAEEGPQGVMIRDIRPSRINVYQSAYHVAQLLWRDEALEVLEIAGKAKGLKTKARSEIWSALAVAIPLKTLRSKVRERLKARTGWRSPGPPL